MLLKQFKTILELHLKRVLFKIIQGLTPESSLADHGLDSLDTIELSMQIEEDLGYVISAETLPQFTKVRHYITYIEQVEAFKR